jgi:hypothetical protein
MTELRTAALRALASLKGYRRELGCHQPCDAERALEAALAYREDIAQAAFERWLVEKLLTVTAAQVAHAEAVESFIKPEIKGHNVEPPPEAQTEAEKIAYCAGWWAAMQKMREQAEPVAWANSADIASSKVTRERGGQGDVHTWSETKSAYHDKPLYTHPPRQWQTLSDEECEAFKKAVEEKLKELNT